MLKEEQKEPTPIYLSVARLDKVFVAAVFTLKKRRLFSFIFR